MQTLYDWLNERAVACLIVRMDLVHTTFARPGEEGVSARLIAHHWDDDGPVRADIHYNCFEGASVGTLEVIVESREDRFREFTEAVVARWEPQEWRQQKEVVLRFGTKRHADERLRWDHRGTANLLVLQHLARIQGCIGEASRSCPGINADWRAVVTTAASRLSSMIQQGNSTLQALTRVS